MQLSQIYASPLTLLTDLYELTMAYGYWKAGISEHEAVFHLFFRKNPFRGGFSIACGQAHVRDYLESFGFTADDLAYLAGLRGNDDAPLFDPEFLKYLGRAKFRCDVDALPEGTAVFPHEPIIRVRGPLWQAQVVETAMLNMVNFQTLIATKSARVCAAAQGEAVLEFGLRRAQGVDGALSASRAAYIGGCGATSNVLAGKLYGIPVKGTHAHSWVMCFDSEKESFEAYANAMPNNCVFLVDTYDTLEGVRRAVDVGKALRARGHEMVGIRLDSGDLARLSIEARRILDDAGFPGAVIVASNDLDEHSITELKRQGATIAVWGVGTKLTTAYDQPALGGVYKLAAIRAPGGQWKHRIKLSEQAIKVSVPGIQQVRRFTHNGVPICDMIYDETLGVADRPTLVDCGDASQCMSIDATTDYHDLLVPMLRGGTLVGQQESVTQIRARAQSQLAAMDIDIRDLLTPKAYFVGLEKQLHELRERLVREARGQS